MESKISKFSIKYTLQRIHNDQFYQTSDLYQRTKPTHKFTREFPEYFYLKIKKF